jgi:hypothetical protein
MSNSQIGIEELELQGEEESPLDVLSRAATMVEKSEVIMTTNPTSPLGSGGERLSPLSLTTRIITNTAKGIYKNNYIAVFL